MMDWCTSNAGCVKDKSFESVTSSVYKLQSSVSNCKLNYRDIATKALSIALSPLGVTSRIKKQVYRGSREYRRKDEIEAKE